MENINDLNDNQDILDEKFINFSYFKHGFLKQWINNYLNNESKNKMNITFKEKLSLIFMILIVVRILKIMRITDLKDRVLVYFGSVWNHLGGNHVYCETTFLFWSINFILLYIFVIQSPKNQFQWLEIYEFLSGMKSYKKIGIKLMF